MVCSNLRKAILTTILFSCTILLLTGQNRTKISINLNNPSLLEVINAIEEQSSFRFVYDKAELTPFRLSTINFINQSIDKILKSIETELPIEFLKKNQIISIRLINVVNQNGKNRDPNLPNNSDSRPNRLITGYVMDANSDDALVGATVKIKGTDIGTVTDINGSYQITGPDTISTLVFSYIGYQTKEVEIGNKNTLNVTLNVTSTVIEEVIVIGYTEKKVKDLTGSVGVLKVDKIANQPINGLEQALQGRVAGLQVTNDGAPGGGVSVRIRGYGTIGDNQPLYIIDGVPTKDGLNQFNFNDVASVQVLKDAAAAAIYGARAANGVVIVTTKKGNYEGNQTINFDTYFGIQEAVNLPTMLNTQNYADLLWQAQKNSGLIPSNDVYGTDPQNPVIPDFIDGDNSIRSSLPGTDWFQELFQPALIQSYNLGYQSGTSQSRMAFSASYLKQEGIMEYTGFERYTIRSNTEFKTKNDLVKIGQNLSFSVSDVTDVPTNLALGSRIIHAYRMNPVVPLRDINGEWASSVRGVQGAENPLALNYFDRNDEQLNSRVFGNVYAVLQPVKGVELKTNFGLDYNIFNRKDYSPRFSMGDAQRTVNSLFQLNRTTLNWVWNNTLSFQKQIANHQIDVLVGTEAIRFNFEEFSASRDDFFTDDINYVYLGSGEGQQSNNGFGTDWALFSVFGRIDYAFADKYLLAGSLRRDGSSRFSNDNRYGIFPAFSVGWRISKEGFLQEINWLNDLKLRGSWGESGNQEIGDFASFSSFATNSNDTNYDLNGTNTNVVTGFAANRLGNPNILWETTTQTNFGIDASLLDYKLTISADYFIKNTEDILLQRPTLAVEGQAEAPFVNAGEMENKGFEFSLGYSGKAFQGFTFSVNANATVVRNKVIQLADDVEFIPGFVSNSSTRNLTISRTQAGLPISQIYGHIVEGIFNSQTEVDNHAEQNGKAIGRLQFQDINNDGIIDDLDRTVIGNPHPDLIYGFNFSANYKNFDLSIFFQGVQGVELYNFTRYYTDFYFDLGNRHERILNAWSPNNTNSTIPRISAVDTNNELRPSSYFVEDGSFLRLKNIQLGYTFLFGNKNRGQLRLYVQGHNLLTITNYEGLDPEVSLASYSNRDRNLDLGVDRGVYPNSRILSVGANFKF